VDQLSDLPRIAVNRSQITLAGSAPFHLKASVVEATNPENDNYEAEIEEYWAGPQKFRRTVKTEAFSQTLVVNGEKSHEDLTGNYYPNWLRTLVLAIFEPGTHLEGVDLTKSSDNPRPDLQIISDDGKVIVQKSPVVCRRFAFRAGIPPDVNNVFSTYCFEDGRLESIGVPGYRATYKNYRPFGGKEVARVIREWIESGTELEARITLLETNSTADESLFSIAESNTPLETLVVDEKALRDLGIDTPSIVWPTIRSGKSAGMLSIYVCVDREGKVRETYGLNGDHPDMTDAAREQVSRWRFKPVTSRGMLAQVEGILTFSYRTRVTVSNQK
jgi:hypothetical protein